MSISTTHSTSRSSIDLGATPASINADKGKPTRPQPPRLQHSPSLPNIWFPPHSGPIPPMFEAVAREPLQRPPTPLSSGSRPIAPDSTPVESQKAMEHRGTVSFDDLSTYLPNTKPLKIQRRRRVDREHGHSLLTPPLTPSSSLRTVTSIDSAASNVEAPTDAGLEIPNETHNDGGNYESTRFLLIGNISRAVSPEVLQSAIISSLTSTNPDRSEYPNTLSVPTTGPQLGPLNDDSIKGVFVRCQKSHGFVMLAFFDPRHAAIAKVILSVPSTGPLVDCLGDEPAGSGSKSWIFCEFITAEKLAETIGHSAFLASTDGSFLLLAEGRGAATDYDGKELRLSDDKGLDEDGNSSEDAVLTSADEANEVTSGGEGINLKMLKSLLKSFGSIRSFFLAKDVDPMKPHVRVFHVEYYDLRQANAAYAALHGQVLFGMKLQVFGRNRPEGHGSQHVYNAQSLSAPPDISVDSPKNAIPFPTSLGSTTYPNDQPLQVGLPGQYSQIRERFLYTDPPRLRPRSISAGHDAYATLPPSPTLVSSSQHGISSPTVLYSSMPADATAGSHDHQTRRSSETVAFDTIARPHVLLGNDSEGYNTEHSHSLERVDRTPDDSVPWEGETPVAQLSGSYRDCYYCPSRGASGDCYTYPPRSPLYSPPVQRSPLVSSGLPPAPPAPMFGNGYNYDNRHVVPANHAMNMNMNIANSFEQPMIPHSRSATGETWFPTTPIMVPHGFNGVPFYPQPVQVPASYGTYRPPLNLEAPLQIDPPHHADDIIYRTDPSPASPSSSRLTRALTSPRSSTNNARESSSPSERNQLNISLIEDGRDTRTTVMIKNIPNKMSDRDLIAFIGKVCPRKIDFLYLRMDFQNGCNVGYAFVNFIDVQDLLFFAKKKLGEKWNMFSSEKVLQMSYANYQGKEALVEKFKNSCIMDEREAWRPKIFYSEPGPEQGLPEPFPAPTHLRRKERSSFNRGALYVPGVGRGSANPQMTIQNAIHRQPRDPQRPHYLTADRRRQLAGESDGHGQYSEPRRRPNKLWVAT